MTTHDIENLRRHMAPELAFVQTDVQADGPIGLSLAVGHDGTNPGLAEAITAALQEARSWMETVGVARVRGTSRNTEVWQSLNGVRETYGNIICDTPFPGGPIHVVTKVSTYMRANQHKMHGHADTLANLFLEHLGKLLGVT